MNIIYLLFVINVVLLYYPVPVRTQVRSEPHDQPESFHFPMASACCDSKELMRCVLNTSDDISSKVSRVVMFTYVTPNIQSYASLSCAVNLMYAEGNGYHFEIIMENSLNPYEPVDPRWNKVKILLDAIDDVKHKDVDYFVWIDADMIMLDMGAKIEEIGLQYSNAHVIMSRDVIQNRDKKADVPEGLANSGYILVQNSPSARKIMYEWWNNFERNRMSDQSAFLLLYNAMSIDERAKIRILRPDALNSAFPAWMNQHPGNQFLHLAGESDIFREEVFRYALDSLCFPEKGNASNAAIDTSGERSSDVYFSLPRQLGLSRDRLYDVWNDLDSHRITKLISWSSDFVSLQREFNQRSKKSRIRAVNEYQEYVDRTCNGISNILKNSANEENEKKHRNARNVELDIATIELKQLCFDELSRIAYVREDMYSASTKESNTHNDQDTMATLLNIAERFRAAMSAGYDLISYGSEVKAYSTDARLSQVLPLDEVFEMLDRIGEELLPKLKRYIPDNLAFRGMYYEFKYFEFLSTTFSYHERSSEVMDALTNAIRVWKVLHEKFHYYGTDYAAVDRLREGWTIIGKYGLLACSKGNKKMSRVGVDSLQESIDLLETTFEELQGNPLSTPPLQDSVSFDLSIAHVNCGICTKQLNFGLSSGDYSDKSDLLRNLKQSKLHFEKSLHYLQYVDQSSGSSNNQHEEYASSELIAIEKDIEKLERQVKHSNDPANPSDESSQDSTRRVLTKKLMRKKKKKKARV